MNLEEHIYAVTAVPTGCDDPDYEIDSQHPLFVPVPPPPIVYLNRPAPCNPITLSLVE